MNLKKAKNKKLRENKLSHEDEDSLNVEKKTENRVKLWDIF